MSGDRKPGVLHQVLPEIIEIFEERDHFFALLACEKEGIRKNVRFGVTAEGYKSLKKILDLRPFDKLPGAPYRYFFTPAFQKMTDQEIAIHVRVEQGKTHKEFQVTIPMELAANILWIFGTSTWEEFSHLTVHMNH